MVALESELEQLLKTSTIFVPSDDSKCMRNNLFDVFMSDSTPLPQRMKNTDQLSSVNERKKSVEQGKQCMDLGLETTTSFSKGFHSAPVISESVLKKKKVGQERKKNRDSRVYENGKKEDFSHKTKRLRKINEPTLHEGHYSGSSCSQRPSVLISPSDAQNIRPLIARGSAYLSEERYSTNKSDGNNFTREVSASHATDLHSSQVLQPFESSIKPQRLMYNNNGCSLLRTQRQTVEEPRDKSSVRNSNVILSTSGDGADLGIRNGENENELLQPSFAFVLEAPPSPASECIFALSEPTSKDESYTACERTSDLNSSPRNRMSASFSLLPNASPSISSLYVQSSANDIVRYSTSCSSPKQRVSKSFSAALEGKNGKEKHLEGPGKKGERDIPLDGSPFEDMNSLNSLLLKFTEGKKNVEESLRVSSESVGDSGTVTSDVRRTQVACVSLDPLDLKKTKRRTREKKSFPTSEERAPSPSKKLQYCSNTSISVMKRTVKNNMNQHHKIEHTDEQQDDLPEGEKNSTSDRKLDCDAENNPCALGREDRFSRNQNDNDTSKLTSFCSPENMDNIFSSTTRKSYFDKKKSFPSEYKSTVSPSAFKTEEEVTSCAGDFLITNKDIGRTQMRVNEELTSKKEHGMKDEKNYFFEGDENATYPSVTPFLSKFLRLTAPCKVNPLAKRAEGGTYSKTKGDSVICETIQELSEKSISVPHSSKKKNYVSKEGSLHRVNTKEICVKTRFGSSKNKSNKKSNNRSSGQRSDSQIGQPSMTGLFSTGRNTLKSKAKNTEFKDANESDHDVYSTTPFSTDIKNMEQKTVETDQFIVSHPTDKWKTFPYSASVRIPTIPHRNRKKGTEPLETEIPVVNSEGRWPWCTGTSMSSGGDIQRVSNENQPVEKCYCRSFCTTNRRKKSTEEGGSSVPFPGREKMASVNFCC